MHDSINVTTGVRMNDQARSDEFDIVIVGAGPSGLAAANRCLIEGVSFAVFEKGRSLESRSIDLPEDMVTGVGGAGLYSDGKFSFSPSGHALWALPGKRVLREAYGWLQTLTSDLLGDFPEYPTDNDDTDTILHHHFLNIENKKYQSVQLSENNRSILLGRLTSSISHRIYSNHCVTDIERYNDGYKVHVRSPNGAMVYFYARHLLLCLGRFGFDFIRNMQCAPSMIYRRFEYGIRIEQDKDEFFLADDLLNDPKYIFTDQERKMEWRTFCCCKQGKVIGTKFEKLSTYSGAAATGSQNSNIGFNCRISSIDIFNQASAEASGLLCGMTNPFMVSLNDFMQNPHSNVFFGKQLDTYIKKGLLLLCDKYNIKDATIYGPCIEGTGVYPKLSPYLESDTDGIYVAGDYTGNFRGLLAALMSGIYAAAHAAKASKFKTNRLSANATIKVSSVNSLPLVFTAQSKHFFYCRDVICEFVLKNGCLPINPFRVFDYFLSDRVDRDLVRQGNNQLVQSCNELWVFGPLADGVLFELFYAAHVGKPIRFFSVGTKLSDIRELSNVNEIRFEPEVHASQQTRNQLLNEIDRLLLNSAYTPKERTLFDYQ